MSSLHAKQVAIAKKILETTDEALLRSVDDLVSGQVGYQFTKAEIAEFEERLRKYENGELKAVPWGTVRQQLQRKYGA